MALWSTFAVVVALVVGVAIAQRPPTESSGPDVDDFKCPACDYAVLGWFHQALAMDFACAKVRDEQFNNFILRVGLPETFDTTTDCTKTGSVALGAIEGLAGDACTKLLLDVFPYIEEFDADQDGKKKDPEEDFDSPPLYFSEQPVDTPQMDDKHKGMLIASCKQSINVAHLKRRLAASSAIASAVSNVAAPDLDVTLSRKLDKEMASLTQMDAASIDAATLLEGDDDDDDDTGNDSTAVATSSTAGLPRRSDNAMRLLRAAKRGAVYKELLILQKQLCSSACGASFDRPAMERRVRGWSASLKRL